LPDTITHDRHCEPTPTVSLGTLLCTQNIDFGFIRESGESSTGSLPGSFPVPTIQGEASKLEASLPADDRGNSPFTKQDSADSMLDGVGHAAEYSCVLTTQGLRSLFQFTRDILRALSKIRRSPSNVWPSLSEFAHVERDRLLTAIVVT
jgi:hypothetical protein